MFKFLLLFFLTGLSSQSAEVNNPDLICGKWMSSSKDLIVQVYKEGASFKAKIVWYKNIDTSKAMDEWTDSHNPDPALKSRKLIGMSILRDMVYVPKSNTWENGKIYDSRNGREWSASIRISNEGELKVTGYWAFKFIGRTMTFNRVA